MAILTFKRMEKKYLLDRRQYEAVSAAVRENMKRDDYGRYTLCNIYYDTDTFDLIRRSGEKPPYKEKLRLRSYGTPQDGENVFFELKKKFNGVVYKRRISLPIEDAVDFADYGVLPRDKSQVMREIDFFLHQYNPSAKVFLAYDREAYAAKDGSSLRLTFDTGIRFRTDRLDLRLGDDGERLLDDDTYLMEIKGDAAMPLWLCHILTENTVYPTSFSKYGRVYEKLFAERRITTSGEVKRNVI